MHPVAHGIDIVEIARIAQMEQEHGPRFLERCFTPDERDYAGEHRRRAEHLAARFAAKEAVMKALGTGLSEGISWTDISVSRSATGAPQVVLTGRAAEIATAQGITSWLISLSHTGTLAMASVIGLGGAP